jgi:hypothetical protein
LIDLNLSDSDKAKKVHFSALIILRRIKIRHGQNTEYKNNFFFLFMAEANIKILMLMLCTFRTFRYVLFSRRVSVVFLRQVR